MKRAWIIPAVICLLLLAAWPFRWEKGPVQSDSKAKIIHMRDRWTGQAWVALYGIANGEVYSGEMRPVPSQADIARRREQILASPEEIQKRQGLENRLAKCEEIKKLHSTANAKYLELVKKNYAYNNVPFLDQKLRLAFADRDERYEHGIPQDIINARVAYYNADREEMEIRAEIDTQQKWAETAAKSDLSYFAWRKRNIATGIWAGLVALSAVMAGILFICASRSRQVNAV